MKEEYTIEACSGKIVLRTKMNVRLGVAACSVSESKCNGGRCTAIKIVIE